MTWRQLVLTLLALAQLMGCNLDACVRSDLCPAPATTPTKP